MVERKTKSKNLLAARPTCTRRRSRGLGQAQSLGLLDRADSELLRGAWQLYADLGQILRLCLSRSFDPKQAGPGLLTLLARAAGLPDFTTLDAHLNDTQKRVRERFKRLVETEVDNVSV